MKKAGFLLCGIFVIQLASGGSPLEAGDNVRSWERKQVKCEVPEFRLDSAYSYIFNMDRQDWQLNTRHTYFYTDFDRFDYWIVDKVPEWTRDNRVDFIYDEKELQVGQVYQRWTGGKWTSTVKLEYFHNEKQVLDSLIVFVPQGTSWKPTQVQVYAYDDEGRTDHYLVRRPDGNGNWYDDMYRYYLYNAEGLITEWYHQLAGSGQIIFRAVLSYTYDEQGRTVETLTRIFTPETGGLVNNTRSVASYDIFGVQDITVNYKWNEGKWVPGSRTERFHSAEDVGMKIPLCHKGKTICVSINAVPAHLAHGDRIGKCEGKAPGKHSLKSEAGGTPREESMQGQDLKIYPVPATERVSIRFGENTVKPDMVRLIGTDGRVRASFRVADRNEIVIERGDLEEGIYLLLFTGDNSFTERIIFR